MLAPPSLPFHGIPDQQAIDINCIGFVYRDVSMGCAHDARVLRIGESWPATPLAIDHTDPAQSSEPNDRHRQLSHTTHRRRFYPI